MGKVFKKIISSGTFGLLGGDDEDKSKDKAPEPETTAKPDPVDQAQVDFNREKLERDARRSRINAQKPLNRSTTGLRVSLSSEPNRTGVQIK